MHRLAIVFVLVGCGGAVAPSPVANMASVGSAGGPSGWDREYNKPLASWKYEKHTRGPDGIDEVNRFYVDQFPEDAPADMDGYAAKLVRDNFQDFGYRYSQISARTTLGDGWLLVGTMTPLQVTDDDRPEPGFVMRRRIGATTILCKAGAMKSEAMRDEAIEMCKRYTP